MRMSCLLMVCIFMAFPAGAAAADRNRAQVFVVGMSDDLRHKASQINQLLRTSMKRVPRIEMIDLAHKLQPPAPESAKNALKEARQRLKSAKEALREMEYGKAAEHAQAARRAFEKMGGHIQPLRRYMESILLEAAAECMEGNTEKSKAAFLDLLLLDPDLKLSKSMHEGFVIEVFEQVRSGLAKMPRGSLAIKSKPAGGNIYLDGKDRGITPETLEGLIAGNHLVVVKLPGFENWGKVVRVEPGNLVSLDVKLTAGKSGGGFGRMVERAGRAITDKELLGEVLRLGQTLGLDWVWICQLKHDGYDLVLAGYLFEFSHSRVLYKARLTLEAAGYGMEEEVRKFAQSFLRRGQQALIRFREEGDPLKHRAGTEDWNRDEGESARQRRDTKIKQNEKRKSSGETTTDPLDEVDGTEDW